MGGFPYNGVPNMMMQPASGFNAARGAAPMMPRSSVPGLPHVRPGVNMPGTMAPPPLPNAQSKLRSTCAMYCLPV